MITIVDYGMGNLGSVLNMFKKIGAEAEVSSEPSRIAAADKLVLPGVGAFDKGVESLSERGLVGTLEDQVLGRKVPILGICLGAQLMGTESEEGGLPGLGWIDARTVRFRFPAGTESLRVPHMGWNTIRMEQVHPLLSGYDETPRFYFVHSFHILCNRHENVLATSTYGIEFTAAVSSGHIIGTQFHPEKSHLFGLRLLRNFAEMV